MSGSGTYWHEVRARGGAVPEDRPLVELTAELTRMLGDPDPQVRETIAVSSLSAWIARGVYDDLLSGLGDGMVAGLSQGLPQGASHELDDQTTDQADQVYRRAASVTVLAACLARDTRKSLVPGGKALEWGDRLVTWLLTDRDLRAVAPGAAALMTLAESRHTGPAELAVILDVVADRVLEPISDRFTLEESDALARAAVAVLALDVVPFSVVEPWVVRLGNGANERGSSPSPASHRNAETFLRTLHTRVSVGRRHFACRADLVLLLVDVLREIDPSLASQARSDGVT